MIAKNIKGKSFKGCVSYVMHEGAELLEAEGVWTETRQDIIRSFAVQRSGRKEIKQPVGHIPLSFSPRDNWRMTNGFMLNLAKEYMKEMGITNTQYIIVRHHDTSNDHLHIVYNRIDNDLKLISVNNDYRRNIKACKKLKDKYGLTYGKGKEKVNREELNNPDKIKYLIHDAVAFVLPYCKNENDLQSLLERTGIETELKRRRTTGEIEGISFRCDGVAFKGSQIDRKFSFGNLKKAFEANRKALFEQQEEQKREAETTGKTVNKTEKVNEKDEGQRQIQKPQQQKSQPEHCQEQPLQEQKQPLQQKTTAPTSLKTARTLTVGGVKLTPEQMQKLKDGEYIFVENMQSKSGKKASDYMFYDEDMSKAFYTYERPDSFVRYGKYEMRLMDKKRIEAGFVTRATVKWYGYGQYAHPYLWKDNKSDAEYRESWSDPRVKKEEKIEKTEKNTESMTRKKGRRM